MGDHGFRIPATGQKRCSESALSTIVIHNHFSELSSLFSIYFGQDYDLFTDAETAEGVIDGFLEQNGSQVIRDILEETKEFQATYAGRI